ncbi:MAG TPA: glycosyltransferase family 1 protein [Spirochaetota bacterium]|nr:glycosyltransferase family 1 protein [Spirochaetota bacterium]
MIIRYDYQAFSMQNFGGISRYFTQIIRRIAALPGISVELNILFSHNHYLLELPEYSHIRWFENRTFPGQSKLLRIFKTVNKLQNIMDLNKSNFHVYHPTYYNVEYLPFIDKRPFVLTVHDMIHDIYPEFFRNQKITNQKKILMEKASKIIAVSESTRNDILRFYPEIEDKLEVVYHANSLDPEKNIKAAEGLPEKYILFVGDRKIYKNFNFFIRNSAEFFNEDDSLSIVCAGGGSFSQSEIQLLKELNLINRVTHVPAKTDNELVNLYSNALLFVFPSVYEGFGIPILEAFACGCPVLASNASSLPEVGGNAVAYFNPHDSISFKDSFRSLMENSALRKSLKEKGLERLKNFSWEKTVDKTIAIYNSVL